MPEYPRVYNRPGEIWKPVQDIPGYKVSNCGRVKSYLDRGGNLLSTAHLMKFQYMSDGSSRVTLSHYGVTNTVSVARLVLNAFVGPPPTEFHVPRFIDGNVKNARVENLEWALRKNVKLSLDDVKTIRNLHLTTGAEFDITKISNQYKVSKTTIRTIINNQAWKHA